MKFLVIGTMSKPVPSYPQATFQKMWDDTFKGLEKARKAGSMLAMYYMPGWEKVVSIEEHNSAEEIMETLSANPMGDFWKWEVFPIAEFSGEALKILAKMFNITVK